MTVQEAYERFLRDKQVQNLTAVTMKSYTEIIRLFVRFVGGDADASVLDVDVVKSYILHLQARGLSGKTIHTYLKNIKVFYSWLYGPNHCIALIRVRYERKLPEVLTKDEIRQLFLIPSLRDRLIVCLVLDCGIRKAELSRLKVEDIRGNRLFVRQGKGRKDRVVPLSPAMADMLESYIRTRKGKTDYLFETKNGDRLTYHAIRALFRRLKDKTGISRLSPHLLRHTYGTYYIDNGGDIKTLQILMGHSEVKTTETYIHLAENLHVEKYSEFSIFNVLSKEKDSL